MNADIILKLQRHGGHQGWRIRPYPINPALWLAETSIWGHHIFSGKTYAKNPGS